MVDFIHLKWGTLNGWNLENSPETKVMLRKYLDLGVSTSAMLQKNTDEQKALICQAIDVFEGEIRNDWSGEVYTKEQAKEYINTYGENLKW